MGWKNIPLYVTEVIVKILSLAGDIFRTFWYLSLLINSLFEVNFPVITSLDEIRIVLEGIAAWASILISTAVSIFKLLFGWVKVSLWFDLAFQWDCAGWIRLITWGVLVLCFAIVRLTIGSSFLFKVAIQSNKYKKGKGLLARLLISSLIKLAMSLIFYILQVVVLIMNRIVFASLLLGGPPAAYCGATDQTVYAVSTILLYITTAMLVLWYFVLFSTSGEKMGLFRVVLIFLTTPFYPIFWVINKLYQKKSMCQSAHRVIMRIGFGNVILSLLRSTKRIVKLTIGRWDRELLTSFKVIEMAYKFDDDPDDADNQHESVMSIYGRSRGILFVFFPGLVFFTKVAEMMNSPPIFEMKNYSAYIHDAEITEEQDEIQLELKTSKKHRVFKWIFNLVQIIATLISVMIPNAIVLAALFLALVPNFIVDLVVGLKEIGTKTEALQTKDNVELMEVTS